MRNLCGCVEVKQSTVAVVEKFGKHHKNLEAGRHYVPCICGYQVAGEVSLKIEQLDNIKCKVKTKENENVHVTAFLQYQAIRSYATKVFYSYSNPRKMIQGLMIHAIAAYAERHNFNELSVIDFSAGVVEIFKEDLFGSGYEVVKVKIVRIKPDKHLKKVLTETSDGQRNAESAAYRHKCIVEGWKNLGYGDNIDMIQKFQYIDAWREIGAKSRSSINLLPPQGPGPIHEVQVSTQSTRS
ncbi:hypothetical protein EUGRSUZ_L03359 [Eucalyptus grandis]|uniref:Band 7 domain-containing protein n=1 Tax=Eucalyptus grandis TaxID=71139 RepID=A0AAD9WID5_EUCGR|nr:hypothetical protein EUGRSUZ_L03359 [Eucalyptus grandis]